MWTPATCGAFYKKIRYILQIFTHKSQKYAIISIEILHMRRIAVKISRIGIVATLSAAMIFGFASCEVSAGGRTDTPTLSRIAVSGTPSKTLYFVGDNLDTTGLIVTAIYSDGSTKTVSGWTFSGFSTEKVSLGSKLTVSYTEGGLTKTADAGGTFYVAAAKARPTERPAALTGYTGTLAGGTYYIFGDFPQTISSLTGENAYTGKPVYNNWYLGSDGYFYAKCTENACENNYTYSDGTKVAQENANSEKYFKVEPIKWRVLNPSAEGNKILVAENILTANVAYYDHIYVGRTIGGEIVFPNNYKHSKIRAYLNGLSYEVKATDSDLQRPNATHYGKGFLQTAFTSTAQALIATTTVDNSAASTNPASNASMWNSGTNMYACATTSDKIFLLSMKEATTSDYGFTEYNVAGEGNSRIRVPTDYAKANHAAKANTNSGWWWLRSPSYWVDTDQGGKRHLCRECTIDIDGKADANTVRNEKQLAELKNGVVPALSISIGN